MRSITDKLRDTERESMVEFIPSIVKQYLLNPKIPHFAALLTTTYCTVLYSPNMIKCFYMSLKPKYAMWVGFRYDLPTILHLFFLTIIFVFDGH